MKPIKIAELVTTATLWQQFGEGNCTSLHICDRTPVGAKTLGAIA